MKLESLLATAPGCNVAFYPIGFALDVDVKGDAKGASELCRFMGFPFAADASEEQCIGILTKRFDTLTVLSPSGGAHYYFRHDDPALRITDRDLLPGVETRGGKRLYLVAPGSSKFGKRWKIAHDTEPKEIPGRITDRLSDDQFKADKRKAANDNRHPPFSLKQVTDMLSVIHDKPGHSVTREPWLAVCGALYNANVKAPGGTANADGRLLDDAERMELFLAWSRSDDGQPRGVFLGDDDCAKEWNNCQSREDRLCSPGSLYAIAREFGFKGSPYECFEGLDPL
jgi:hypothetical protein